MSGPVNPPASVPPAASSNTPETSTNVSVASSTNVSGQTLAVGGNVATGSPGETTESAGLGAPSGVDGSLGSGGGSPTGGEGPTGGGAGPNPGDGTTGDDPNSGPRRISSDWIGCRVVVPSSGHPQLAHGASRKSNNSTIAAYSANISTVSYYSLYPPVLANLGEMLNAKCLSPADVLYMMRSSIVCKN